MSVTSLDSGNATMPTINSTCTSRNKHSNSGRGPVRATIRPRALTESMSFGNVQVLQQKQQQHRSLSVSPTTSHYHNLSIKSQSLGDLREMPSKQQSKKSLQDLVPVPINTNRLKPIQQQTRRACVSITASGIVTLLSTNKNNKQERLSISRNGMEVC